jgi:hypothetical protein
MPGLMTLRATHPDRAHAAFADLLQQLVAAGDDRSMPFAAALDRDVEPSRRVQLLSRGFQKAGGLLVPGQESLQPLAQRLVSGAGFVQEGGAVGRGAIQCRFK